MVQVIEMLDNFKLYYLLNNYFLLYIDFFFFFLFFLSLTTFAPKNMGSFKHVFLSPLTADYPYCFYIASLPQPFPTINFRVRPPWKLI